MKCNICKTPNVEVDSSEDKTYVKCPRCGHFFMETAAYSDKGSSVDIDFMLSSEIRRRYEDKEETFDFIQIDHLLGLDIDKYKKEKPILDKYKILLQYVFDSARFQEFLIAADDVSSLIAKTNSLDLDELSMLFIKAYEEQHLIDFSSDSDVTVKLTFDGKKFLEE